MATATVAQQLALEQLYIAYFGRAADPTGFAYWTGGLAAGTDNLQSIANEFSNSAESKALYPLLGAGSSAVTTQAATDFVTGVYFNLYHRAPDAVGLTYFVSRLTPTNAGDIIKGIADGAQGSDLTSLQARDLAGLNYTTSVTLATYTAGDSIAAVAGTFTLTTATDIASANIFQGGQQWSPGGNVFVNTLQNADVLTGVGTNPTLNTTLGSFDNTDVSGTAFSVQPTLNGIQTINANFNGSAGTSITTLDLQNANGVKTVNILGITDPQSNVSVINFTAVPTNLSVANTSSPVGSVTFATLDGAAKSPTDSTTLTVSNVNIGTLNLNAGTGNGIETVNLVSAGTGANKLGAFNDSDLSTLNISGAANLTIKSIGYNNQGKFTTVDGSTATGNLNLTLDSLQSAATATNFGTTGGDVLFTLKTGSGADTVNSTINFGNGNDIVDAGTAPLGGVDTLALSNTHTQSFTDNATYGNFEAVTVTRTDGGRGLAELTVDSAKVTGDQTFSLVNKTDTVSAPTRYILNNLSAVEATQITIAHSGLQATSSANNDGLSNNFIVANLATQTANDTVGVTVIDGLNTEPRFNFHLSAPGAENIIITDSDTESNTVQLDNVSSHTGTITLTGGKAGQFLNLDASANGYGLDETGLASDLKGAVSTAGNLDPVVSGVYSADYRTTYNATAGGELLSAANITATGEKSDVIVRVTGSNIVGGVAVGGQNIQLGGANDTVIFANRTSVLDTIHTSGLTIADTVNGGAGQDTIILDGSGYQQLGSSEWTNLTGIDVLRLAGAPGNAYAGSVTYVEGSLSHNGYDGHTSGGNSGGSGIYDSGSGVFTSGSGSGSILLGSGSGSGFVYFAHGEVFTPGSIDATTSTTPFVIKVTDQFVSQTDAHNNLTIINNDGDLSSGNENVATINLRPLDAAHNVVFYGPNGNHNSYYANYDNEIGRVSGGGVFHAQQIVQVSDASANGLNTLDGGNPDYSYIPSDKVWNATRFLTGSNNNIYQVWNTAEVTVADLKNTKNFDTIQFRSDLVVTQTLALTLNDTVLHNLVQPNRTASAAAPDRLWIQSVNNYDNAGDVVGYAQLNLDASALTSKSDLVVYASGNADIIRAGGGNDVLFAFDPINGDFLNNIGGAFINGGGGEDYIYLGYHALGDTIEVNTAGSIVHVIGFDGPADKASDVINISADSTIYLESHNSIAGDGIINVYAGTVAIDSIFQADVLNIHGGVTTLTNSWSEHITIDASSTLNLGLHNAPDLIAITGGQSVFLNDSYKDVLTVTGGTTVLGSAVQSIGSDTINFTGGTASVDLGAIHSFDTITVSGSSTVATILDSYGTHETITVHLGTTTNIQGSFGSYSAGAVHEIFVNHDSLLSGTGIDTINLTHANTVSGGGTTIQAIELSASATYATVVSGAIIGGSLSSDTFDLVNDGAHMASGAVAVGACTATNVIPTDSPTSVFSVDIDGAISITGNTLHHGLTLATEILNVLEARTFAGGSALGKDFVFSEHNTVDNTYNGWIFETSASGGQGGQIIELVGLTNVTGFGTTGNQVHVV